MLEKIIENFNLDEREAKVYLASLELGNARVSEIAKKSNLNRITAYEILKRLRQRGLAVSLTKNNVLTFRVIDPDKLLNRIEKQFEVAKGMLPSLMLLKGGNNKKPKVDYFDGSDGLKALYDDSLNCKEKIIYNIAEPGNVFESIGKDYINKYVKKRLVKGIKIKLIMPQTKENKKFIKEAKTALREVRFIDSELYPIFNEFFIYNNKVAILSFSGKMGVIIEDEEIARSMKSIWKLMWNGAVKKF